MKRFENARVGDKVYVEGMGEGIVEDVRQPNMMIRFSLSGDVKKEIVRWVNMYSGHGGYCIHEIEESAKRYSGTGHKHTAVKFVGVVEEEE